MRWTEALQGVRVIKFRSVLGRYESTELNQIEAAELLGITERTFRRWCVRFDADGEAGLLDRRLGKASPKRVPRDSEQEIERLYRTRYQGFTAKHCSSNIEMTPLCQIEMTLPRVLGSRERRHGGVVDEQARVHPAGCFVAGPVRPLAG
jgi:helix-turn-helix protein